MRAGCIYAELLINGSEFFNGGVVGGVTCLGDG